MSNSSKITVRYWDDKKEQWSYMFFTSQEDLEEYEVEHDIEFTEDQITRS